MASALTLHALDEPLYRSLVAYSKREGKSLNQCAKELLASALGVSRPRATDHSEELAPFFGGLEEEAFRRLKKAQKDFETIDEDLWK